MPIHVFPQWLKNLLIKLDSLVLELFNFSVDMYSFSQGFHVVLLFQLIH